MTLCKCGCGEAVKKGNMFIHGHNMKGSKRFFTKEHKQKISISRQGKFTGEKNPFYGKTHTDKTKKKISRKGCTLSTDHKIKISNSLKGSKNPFYGKNHTRSTKQKLKNKWAESIENGDRCGQNHPNWKGGISDQGYCSIFSSKEFRKIILERDGYQCLNPSCLKKHSRLTVHHIDYNKKHCWPMNLITLCVSCNSVANFERQWHESWYSAIVKRRYNGNPNSRTY